MHTVKPNVHTTTYQGCPQDVKSQDRDETINLQDREEIETFLFTVQLCQAYTHGIAVEILSVCPSVRPSVHLSVRPSVKLVYCDKTKAPSEKVQL